MAVISGNKLVEYQWSYSAKYFRWTIFKKSLIWKKSVLFQQAMFSSIYLQLSNLTDAFIQIHLQWIQIHVIGPGRGSPSYRRMSTGRLRTLGMKPRTSLMGIEPIWPSANSVSQQFHLTSVQPPCLLNCISLLGLPGSYMIIK